MIRIGKPYITETDTGTRLNADITVDGCGATKTLWLEVGKEYAKYLCADRSDAFMLGFINYAMRTGHDIVCEGPVTDRLYGHIVETFLPMYFRACTHLLPKKKQPKAFRVEVAGRLDPVVRTGDVVGAGVSCGVDSLHVFATKSDVTHGFIWNMHAGSYVQTDAVRRRMWDLLRKQAGECMKEIGKPLVEVDTNFDTGLFPGFAAETAFSWANLFVLYALQPMFRKYYFASSDGAERFRLAVDPEDFASYYDAMLLAYASSATFPIHLVGGDIDRIDKYPVVADYAPARKLLHVCWLHSSGKARNCTMYCPKCRMTVLGMNAMGVLDRFEGAFDLELFHREYDEFLLDMLCESRKVDDMEALIPYYRKDITLRIRLIYWWRTILRKLFGYEKELRLK